MVWQSRSLTAVCGVLSLTVFLYAGVAAAQRIRRPEMRMPDLPRLEAAGTIDMVAPNGIRITTTTNQVWDLFVSPQCKVELKGTAKRDVLRPGLYVSFVADVDKRLAKVTEKVGKLTVFTPGPERQIGVFPEQGLGGLGQNPGFGAEQPAPNAANKLGPPTERFEVRGQITGVTKTGKFTLFVPNQLFKPTLQFEVADDAQIDLDVAGVGPALWGMARKGDKITESIGVVLRENVGRVDSLKIELTEPYTTIQPKKRPPVRPGKTKPGEEPKEGAEGQDQPDHPPAGDDANPAHKPPAKPTHKPATKPAEGEEVKPAEGGNPATPPENKEAAGAGQPAGN